MLKLYVALALLDTNYEIQKAPRQSKSQDALVERARWPRSFPLLSFLTQLTVTFSETEGGVTFYRFCRHIKYFSLIFGFALQGVDHSKYRFILLIIHTYTYITALKNE